MRAALQVHDGAALRVLAVCTGNVCRSPAAERLLTLRLGQDSGITIESAGVQALVGSPIDPPVSDLLAARGAGVADFSARSLTERIATQADLVLTATRSHRSGVVELAPELVRRSFTLREFARLVADVPEPDVVAHTGADAAPADRLRALADLAARRRSQVPAELDDVPDPYRRGEQDYLLAVNLVADAVDTISDRVLGSR